MRLDASIRMSYRISSHLISSHLISSHLISSHLVSSRLISSHLISSHYISSHLISSHHISSHLISSHLISSHLISSHLISSHFISSHLISSHRIVGGLDYRCHATGNKIGTSFSPQLQTCLRRVADGSAFSEQQIRHNNSRSAFQQGCCRWSPCVPDQLRARARELLTVGFEDVLARLIPDFREASLQPPRCPDTEATSTGAGPMFS